MEHFISLEQAKQMTQKYNNEKNNILKPEYQGRDILSISEAFDRAAFDHVLSQPGCEKLRIYFGMNEDMRVRAIIVGVDGNNKDMLPQSGTATNSLSVSVDATDSTTDPDPEDHEIIEAGQMCPPNCPEEDDDPLYP